MLGPGHYNYGNSSAADDDDGDAAAEGDKQKLDLYGATTARAFSQLLRRFWFIIADGLR